jgi:hypothetical protein
LIASLHFFTGEAGIKATEVATYARSLNIQYANMTRPNLRLIRGPQDLPYLKQVYKQVSGSTACFGRDGKKVITQAESL